MQSLHDQDDRRVGGVLPALQCVLEPLDHTLTDRVGFGLVRFVRVVNDDGTAESSAQLAGAVAGDRAAYAGCVHRTAGRGLPIVLGIGICLDQHIGENLGIGLVPHLFACSVGVSDREVRRIAGMDELGVRVLTQCPRDEIHHRKFRLRIARRHVDDQPLGFAAEHPHQRIADDSVVLASQPGKPPLLHEHPA